MILGDIDPGGSHPYLATKVGQVMGSALVEGSRTIVYPRGGVVEQQDVTFMVTSWQNLGGQSAGSFLAAQYLLRQLEELSLNPDMQPVYIQWTATGQSGQYNVVDSHDGWYVIENFQPDYSHNVVAGLVQVGLTVSRVGSGPPGALRILYIGSALSSTYPAAPVNPIALPVGATGPSSAMTRTGADGAVPISVPGSLGPNPLPIVPSATLANLWLGGVRCYDSVTAGSNAVPTGGAAVHTTWVPIYGPAHALTGDLILSNGFELFRFNQGGSIDHWVWNTQGTAGWVQAGNPRYLDSGGNVGTVRHINVEQVGLRRSRVTVRLSTTAGNFARMSFELDPGHYEPYIEFEPETEANTVANGFDYLLTTAYKVIANEMVAYDVGAGAANLTVTGGAGLGAGWSVAIGTTTNQVLTGLLWVNAPNSAQPRAISTTELGFGETTGPAQGAFRVYSLYAVPFVTSPNLLAEAESGTLGTGWTSTADAGASGGNAAKCASGTASTNADLWGATSFTPTPGKYLPAFKGRVTSAAGTTAEMQIGLWDTTSSVFVPQASTIYRANQLATTYGWFYTSRRQVTDGVTNGTTTVTSATAHFTSADVGKAIFGFGIPAGATISSITNATTIVISSAATSSASGLLFVIGGPVTPTATHAMRMRAVTTATLGTDYWIDESAIVPAVSATPGSGDFPEDIWRQFIGRRRLQLVAG